MGVDLDETCHIDVDYLAQLELVCAALGKLHRELADINEGEIDATALAYCASTASSHSGRDAEARHGTKDYAVQRVQIRGEIEQLRERQTFLLAALKA